MEKCKVKHCRTEAWLTYYEQPVCYKHWTHHCDETRAFDLKKHLGIRSENDEDQTHAA